MALVKPPIRVDSAMLIASWLKHLYHGSAYTYSTLVFHQELQLLS